jgi:hypothetical protein
MTEEQTLKQYFAALKAKRYKVAGALAIHLKSFNDKSHTHEGDCSTYPHYADGAPRLICSNTLIDRIEQDSKELT